MAIGTTTLRTRRPSQQQQQQGAERRATGRDLLAFIHSGWQHVADVLADVGTLMIFGGDAGAVVLRLCNQCELRSEACICDEDARNRATTITRIVKEG